MVEIGLSFASFAYRHDCKFLINAQKKTKKKKLAFVCLQGPINGVGGELLLWSTLGDRLDDMRAGSPLPEAWLGIPHVFPLR